MKSFRSIRRYFRDAIHGVFRNFSLSLASISCITITLIVVAVSLILSYNVEHFSDSIRKDVTVVMFLKKETTKEDLTKIKKELESIENIENVMKDKDMSKGIVLVFNEGVDSDSIISQIKAKYNYSKDELMQNLNAGKVVYVY